MRLDCLAAAATLALTGCASSHQAPAAAPSLAIAAGTPAPQQAQLYADCITQAANTHAYDREENLIRFHCGGDVARAFYERLGLWSAQIGSQRTGDGRTWRFTSVMQHNTTGLDFCWLDDAGGYGCTVVLNAGEFIAP